MTTSTRITPQQNLLSTIYKQSWHPVASLKQPSNNFGLKRPKDTNSLAGNFQKPLPFQSSSEYNHSKYPGPKPSRTESSVKERYRENSRSIYFGTRSSRGTSQTIFTTKVEDCDVQSNTSSVTSLSTWKKQLKTCVESNVRDSAAKQEAVSRVDRSKNSTDRILNLRRQQYCSADRSSAKCYKVLNYQNSTLASICVQGSDPPVKSRLETALRLRSHSSSSSLSPTSAPPKIVNENVFSAPNKELSDRKFVASRNDDEILSPSLSSTTAETDQDLTDDGDEAMQDDAFTQEYISCSKHALKNSIQNAEMCVAEVSLSNLDLLNLNFSKDETDISDNESDISEQEQFSDEEDEISDPFQTDERSRMFVEKYKELYKNENISDKKDQDPIYPTKKTDDFTQSKSKKKKVEKLIEPSTYEFASVFPKEFQKYNLKELSILPYDVNWRDVVKISDLCPDHRLWKKNGYAAKQRRARFAKTQEERSKMESMVDRLLVLEKLQAKTRQNEYMSRYHAAHTRATAARLKAQNAKATSNSLNNDCKQNGSSSEPCAAVPRTPSRRRSSVPLASARLAWANEITRGEHMKEAHRSGDFSAVIDNWSAKNRPSKNNEKGRRSSDCNVKKSRSRWMHPQFYEYHWSEKIKDDKIIPTPRWSSRVRACSTCKEKWRKITSMALQDRRRRPSTAAGSTTFSTFRPSTTTSEKTLTRPKTTGFPLPASPITSSSFAKASYKSKAFATEASTTFNGNTPTATASDCYVIKEHVVPQQASNISTSKPAFLTSAFRVTSAALSKRPQTLWTSS